MSTAAQMRAAYLEAELAILQGKSVTFQGRTLTHEDLDRIRKGRQEWERRAAEEEAGAGGIGALGFCCASFGQRREG